MFLNVCETNQKELEMSILVREMLVLVIKCFNFNFIEHLEQSHWKDGRGTGQTNKDGALLLP